MKDTGAGFRWFLGCGCMAATVLAALCAAALLFVWRSPRESRPQATPPPWRAEWDAERGRTLDTIRRERKARIARDERTVKTGTLPHDRDVSLRCDATLTLSVKAGTFASVQPVVVKAFTVGEELLPPTVAVVAAYDVKIGPGGPLKTPIVLNVSHPPLAEDVALKAVRWDEEKAEWVALRLERRSATSTLVQADHLTRMLVTKSVLSSYERYFVEGSAIGVAIRTDSKPNVAALFARPSDWGMHWKERERQQELRFQQAADSRGFTDLRLPASERYSDAVRRGFLAAVIHAMAQRIHTGAYRGGLPARYDIYVGDFESPHWWQGWWAWEGVYLSTREGMDSAEELAVTLGHEMFHACQYQGGLGETWMRYNMWLMDATAEYAGARLAWGDLASRPFDEVGVRLDPQTLQKGMGSGLEPTFISQPLTATRAGRAYKSAHFLEFMFQRTGLGIEELWKQMKAADSTDRNEAVLAKHCQRARLRLDDVYRDFAANLVLDAKSPAAIPRPAPGADAEPSIEFPSVILDEASPSWTQGLLLSPGYIGEALTVAVSPLLRDAGRRSVTLTFDGTREAAQIEIYRTGKTRVNLAAAPPLRRLSTFAQGPVVLTYSLKPEERLHVIATRGSGDDPRLSVKAELGTLVVRATRVTLTGFRLELTGPQVAGEVEVEWQFGDGATARTRGGRVEHAWPRPGTYEVRATLHDRATGEAIGEATGAVEIVALPATPRPRPPTTTTTTRPPVAAPPQRPVPDEETAPVTITPSRPKPAERRFDEAAALAAWLAEFEARYKGTEHVANFSLEYRLEWVARPYISRGLVLGNYRLLKQRRWDDGRVDDWFEENAAQSQPFELTTVSKLQDKYPQFWR